MRHPVFRLRDLPLALAFAVAVPMLAAGPAAASAGHGQLIVNPGTVSPGQSVSILGTCPVNGVQLTGVYSPAFVGDTASISKTQINFSGSATISPSASGSYTVSAACGPGSPSVTITVSGTRPVAEPSTPAAPTTAPTSPSAESSHSYIAPATTIGGPGIVSGSKSSIPAGAADSPTASASAAATIAPAPSTAAAAPTGDGPVTSTGLGSVGLADSTRSTMTSMRVPAVLAVAASALGALVFLGFRRRRATARNTHS